LNHLKQRKIYHFGEVSIEEIPTFQKRVNSQSPLTDDIWFLLHRLISLSPTHELNAAIGQFIAYRLALEELEPDRRVYLAVPIATYSDFMQRPFPRRMIDVNRVPLMVYDPIQEEILKWL
jgi:XisH protein